MIDGQLICPDCRPTYLRHARVDGTAPYPIKLASILSRAVALVADIIILCVAFLTYTYFFIDWETVIDLEYMHWGHSLLWIALPFAYKIYFVGKFGATPGKMAVGIRIVRSDGSPLGYGRAFVRYGVDFACGWLTPFSAGELAAFIIAILPYAIALFDDEKRTLHDHICDTRVVWK